MAKIKQYYQCASCSYHSPVSLGRCPECGSWNSFSAVREESPAKEGATSTWTGAEQWLGKPNPTVYAAIERHQYKGMPAVEALASGSATKAKPITSWQADEKTRYSSGYDELDRVLGGGFLAGAYILVGGDPGIGKSTLMLQAAARLAAGSAKEPSKKVLYVTGEESPFQVRLRAERLGALSDKLWLLAETDMRVILQETQAVQPDLLIVDSVQAVYCGDVSSPPGSVGQIRAVANLLMSVAKSWGLTVVLVGHVTKDGQLSGPKLLEHMVDCVLYFEGEKYKDLRLLRSVKNRFGSTLELGVFEMAEGGLNEVSNPSKLFLGPQGQTPMPGCVTVCTLEGTRPLLVELQALVGMSAYASGRRVATGLETNRLHQILAVLERRLGLDFSNQDIYVNVVGGLRIDEPAADLGLALALVSSLRNLSLISGMVVIGELGLTGEVRSVRNWRARLHEAEKIGLKRCLLPASSYTAKEEGKHPMQVHAVHTLMDAVALAFEGKSETAASHAAEEPLYTEEQQAKETRYNKTRKIPF